MSPQEAQTLISPPTSDASTAAALVPGPPPILDKNHKVMIVDDVSVNVKVVRAHLETAGYREFICITDATEALETIRRDTPDIVLLDIMMPEISGLDILRAVRAEERLARLPILILTGAESRELKTEALQLGATDFLTKPVDSEELIPRVRNALLMKSYEDDLKAQVDRRTEELERSQREIIHCLARAAEFRDNETGRHVIRVGKYAGIIADELGVEKDIVALITQAATLHDVGKIGIPDSVLLKPGKLTPEEYEIMQKHCGFGKKVFEKVSVEEQLALCDHTSVGASILEVSSSPIIKMARSIALTHHEKWDGSGYPLGLAGENIPLEGRITAVADVFDALSSKRPYKPAFPLDKCLSILKEDSGTHFEPAAVDAFIRRTTDIVDVQLEYADVC